MLKIAIVFNNQIRKDTTGGYCLKALSQMPDVAVNHFLPNQPINTKYDMYIRIDDGVPMDFSVYADKKPFFYWAIDTHLGFEERISNSKLGQFTKVYLAQKNDVEKFQKEGINTEWLPLAACPEIHNVEKRNGKEYDVCFVGHTNPKADFMQKRIDYIDTLFKNFPNFFYGQKFFDEATKIYNKSKIVFNCAVKNDVNMRCFEATCSGNMVLTDKIENNGFEDLGFIDGVNIAVYSTQEEMVEKAKFYLENEAKREEIAKAGQKLTLENNTYRHRMEKVINDNKL